MAGVRCFGCGVEFGFFKREHSCKNCNRIFCNGCTSKTAVIESSQVAKKVRVCDKCYKILTGVQQEPMETKSAEGKLNDLDNPAGQSKQSYQERGKGFCLSLGKNIPSTGNGNENSKPDPDKELMERLSNLKNGPDGSKLTSDEELGKRFSELTGRTATCMQKSDINTPRPKKTGVEEVDDLLSQVMSEHQIDERTSAENVQVTDSDIEERLARLKGIDPEAYSNSKVNWDSDEDEETQMNIYLKQVLAEAMLEDKTDSMGLDVSKPKPASKLKKSKQEQIGNNNGSIPQATGMSSNIWDKDYEADSDDDELPWCCICNANAVLRCQGCDNDLYCKRCYREGHSKDDFEDHPTTTFKPPKKQR